VDVIDAGPGVPEEHRERIFDRFHKADEARTRGHGSGLGLGIARDNARLLGGDVMLEPSGPDQGAHFRLDLPAVTGT
jgi:two-component system sensor histidine kinase MtrB